MDKYRLVQKGLYERLAEVAARWPERTAIAQGSRRLTYDQVLSIANRVARWVACATEPGAVVGLQLQRRIETVPVLMGIIGSGRLYLPIGTAMNSQMLSRRLLDAKASLLVTDVEPSGALDNRDITVLSTEACLSQALSQSSATLEGMPIMAIAVMYTSGTSGEPKQVRILQKDIVAMLDSMWRQYPNSAGDVALSHRSLEIVGSLWDNMGQLLRGVPLEIAPESESRAPTALLRRIKHAEVTWLSAGPTLLKELCAAAERIGMQCPSVRCTLTGGDHASPETIQRWRKICPYGRIINVYGTTEYLYIATHDVTDMSGCIQRMPVGRPLHHREISLKRADGWADDEEVGEICIVNRSDIETRGRASSNNDALEGPSVQKTGDIGRFNGGLLEILERNDCKIKILDHLVDPRSIELALESISGVRASAVAPQVVEGRIKLVAWIVLDTSVVSLEAVRQRAHGLLPLYAVPHKFNTVEDLPRTAGGKIDRRRLNGLERWG